MTNNGKALVVFFSHAGENYSVGNIEVGNTKIVADYISEITGADQFEIVTRIFGHLVAMVKCLLPVLSKQEP